MDRRTDEKVIIIGAAALLIGVVAFGLARGHDSDDGTTTTPSNVTAKVVDCSHTTAYLSGPAGDVGTRRVAQIQVDNGTGQPQTVRLTANGDPVTGAEGGDGTISLDPGMTTMTSYVMPKYGASVADCQSLVIQIAS